MNDQPNIPDFIIGNFNHAAGILSGLFGNTESWDNLADVPHTFRALRGFPPNFQDEVAKPILEGIFATLGLPVGTEFSPLEADRAAFFDEVIAAAVTDGCQMVMSSLQMADQQQKQTRNKLLRGI